MRCAVYGAPEKLSNEQELWLSLNLTLARMVQIEHLVVANEILSGNPPAEWCEYVGMTEADQLTNKLASMMA